jgi:hypothetical protein
MANVHEHLEHAEHSQHAAHDPFDRRVAMTMAIMAAVLAGISLLSHRTHNDVLREQAKGNALATAANILHTEATDTWGEYQARNIRKHMYELQRGMLDVLPKAPGTEKATKDLVEGMDAKIAEYGKTLPPTKAKAEGLVAAARGKQQAATAQEEEVHYAHQQATRLDVGHLLAEIGLVVCSVSLLTKRKAYWLIGIASAVLALATAGSAYLIPKHESHAAAADHAPAGGHTPAGEPVAGEPVADHPPAHAPAKGPAAGGH